MAKYGSNVVKIEFDNSSGALVDLSAYITECDEIKKQANLEEITAFFSAWEQHAASGTKKVDKIGLKFPYDDAATTGPNVIFDDIGCEATSGGTRTLKVTWGGGKTTSVETIIEEFNRAPKVGKLTGGDVSLQPTGAVTEA